MKVSHLVLATAALLTSGAAFGQSYYMREKINVPIVAGAPSTPPASGSPGSGAPSYTGTYWTTGEAGPWDSTCAQTALRTVAVSCMKNGVLQEDSVCNPAERPDAAQVGPSTEGCGSAFINPGFANGMTGWNHNGVTNYDSPLTVDGDGKISQLPRAGSQISQAPTGLKAGQSYRATISGWQVVASADQNTLQMTAGSVQSSITRIGNNEGWHEISIEFVYQPNMPIVVSSAAGAWWIDGMRIRPL